MTRAWARCVAATAVAFALTVAGCASDEERFARHRESAQEYASAGQFKEALLELRTALKLQPQDAEVNLEIARLLLRMDGFEDAVFFLREARRLDPTLLEPTLRLVALLMGSDVDEATELMNEALEKAPDDPLTHIRLAELSLVKNDTETALVAARTATELDPQDGQAHNMLGTVHQARIRERVLRNEEAPDELYGQAIASFDEAIELLNDPASQSAPRLLRARVYAKWEGHEAETDAAYRELLSSVTGSDKKLRVAMGSAALTYADAHDDEDLVRFALAEIQRADPTAIFAWRRQAFLEEESEGGEDGEDVFKRMLEAVPDEREAHLAWADYLASKDRLDEGFEHLAQAAARGVTPARTLGALAERQILHGRMDEAKETLARMREEFPNSPAQAYPEAQLAKLEDRYQDAIATLEKAMPRIESPEAWELLAESHLAAGQAGEAVAAVDRALQLREPAPIPTLRLALRIYQANQDWQRVQGILQQIRTRTGTQLTRRDQVVLARSFYGLERPGPARRMLRAQLAHDKFPSMSAVVFARHEAANFPEEALGYLEKASKLYPNYREIEEVLLEMQLQLGRSDEARETLDRLLAAGKPTPRRLLLQARVQYLLGDHAEAERAALRAFEAAPQLPMAMPLLISIYQAQGRVDEAAASFEEARQAGALPPSGIGLLGALYALEGKRVEAQAAYEEALQRDPDLARVANDLAYLLAEDERELDRALQLAEEAHRQLPDQASVADTLGFVYHKRGLNDAAVEQLRFAVELAEKTGQPSPLYHYHLAQALRARGDSADAVSQLESALALESDAVPRSDLEGELAAARAELAAAGAKPVLDGS